MQDLIGLRILVFIIRTTGATRDGGNMNGTDKSQFTFLKEHVGCSVEQGHEWKWETCQVVTAVVQKTDDG